VKFLYFLFAAGLVSTLLFAQETPVSPETIQSVDALNKDTHPLIISGFGVGTYNYLFNNNQNTFSSSALALSVFKQVNDRLSVFAQLTTSLEGPSSFLAESGGGTESETEIDNLQLRWVPSTRGPEIVFGKFDSPMGIERDDAPLNYQATESFNFTFGRPVKFTGVQLHQAFSEHFEGWAILANGWDQDPDNNKGKTFGAYGMWIPKSGLHIGLGEILGPESDGSEGGTRKETIATFQLQPASNIVIGAEGNYGTEPFVASESSSEWYGGLAFIHYRFPKQFAVTLRYESFRDRDGARTGVPQTLSSFTISPQYIFSRGFYGIFRYLERTTMSLPEVAVRVDIRFDHSNEPVFVSNSEEGKKDNPSVTFQTVFLF